MSDHPKSECPECGEHESTHEPGYLPLYDHRSYLYSGAKLVYPRATILGVNRVRAEGTTRTTLLLPEPTVGKSKIQELIEKADAVIADMKEKGLLIDFDAAHAALDRLDENGDDPYVYTEADIKFMAGMRGMTVEQWVEHQIDEITRPSILEQVAMAAKDGKPINRIGFGSRITREEEVRDCQPVPGIPPLPEGVFILEKGEQVIPPPAKNSPIQSLTVDLSKQAKALAVYEWMLKYNPAMVAQILRETTSP